LAAASLPDEKANIGCKDWEGAWGFPCRDPHDGWSPVWGDEYPIIAWSQPTQERLPQYAAANFTLTFTRLDPIGGKHNLTDESDASSLDRVVDFVEEASRLGLVSSFLANPLRMWHGPPDPPVVWGNATGGLIRGRVGAAWQGNKPVPGAPWSWKPRSTRTYHYLTLPEVKWLVGEFRARNLTGAAAKKLGAIFLHDDGMDLLEEAVEIGDWLRANQPDLVPHINEVLADAAPGSLQRRSFFISSNEVYYIWQGHGAPSGHPRGSAALMGTLQLQAFDTLWRNQHRCSASAAPPPPEAPLVLRLARAARGGAFLIWAWRRRERLVPRLAGTSSTRGR
jgi:hypothetical protein